MSIYKGDQNMSNGGVDLTGIQSEIDDIKADIVTIGTIKVDKVSGKQLSTNDFTTAEKTKLSGIATGANNTVIVNNLTSTVTTSALSSAQGKVLNDTKVDKVNGKGLSSNDFTLDEKNKLANIQDGAEVNIQTDWNATAGDAVILNKPTSLPANGGNSTTVDDKTANGILDTTEQINLVTAINEVKTLAEAGVGGVKNIIDGSAVGSLRGINSSENANYVMGINAVALGVNSKARGINSFAVGENAIANGRSSISLGYNTSSTGTYTTTTGQGTQSSGTGSQAHGLYTGANGYGQTAIGVFNIMQGTPTTFLPTDLLFIIGNGTSASARSNALTVTWDGMLEVAKEIRVAGNPLATSIRNGTGAGSLRSINAKNGELQGNNAVALGENTVAVGSSSFATGSSTRASGSVTTSFGNNTTALGNASFTNGLYTYAQGQSQTAIGKYNAIQGNTTGIAPTDHAFIIGNGVAENARSNALSVTWDGTLNVAKDVTVAGVSIKPPTIINNITTSATGSVLDASQGYILNNKIDNLQSNMIINKNLVINGTRPSNIASMTWANVALGNEIRMWEKAPTGGEEIGGCIYIGGNVGSLTPTRYEIQNVYMGTNICTSSNNGSSRSVYIGHTVAFTTGGVYNTAVGHSAFYDITDTQFNLQNCTAIGAYAGVSRTTNLLEECTSLGANAKTTATKQVQIGGSGVTVYGASAYNVRSDSRDKADITDLNYDYVNFIKNIKPRNYRIDQREDYEKIIEISKSEYDLLSKKEQSEYKKHVDQYVKEVIYPKDGSRKRNRVHNGFIAQEIKEVADSLNFDFAGFQDHKLSGGLDIYTLAYEEFITPMVATIQYLLKQNELLSDRIYKLEYPNPYAGGVF